MILIEETNLLLNVDLSKDHNLSVNVWVSCDYCCDKFVRRKDKLIKARSIVDKDACRKCGSKKLKDVNLVKYGTVSSKRNFKRTEESIKKSTEKGIKTKKERYGDDWGKLIINRTKEVMINKYGVENCSNLDFVKEKKKEKIEKRTLEDKIKINEKRKQTLKEYYGEDYQSEILKKRQETVEERYGVSHYSKTDEFKEKYKSTCEERYGVDYYDYMNNLRQETVEERYGVSHYSKTDEFKEKYKATCEERYGVTNPNKLDSIKQKKREIFLANYGVETPLLFEDNLEKSIIARKSTFGKTQTELKEWINSFGFNFQTNYSLLKDKEVDLFDPNKNLAIEYCGLYWHNEFSPTPRDRSYHYNKYKKCFENNVRLITLFEDEWLHRNNQCKGILMSCLGIGKNYNARQCTVVEIPKKEACNFYESNHLLGKSMHGLIFFGLKYNEELLQVMSLGRHHRNKDVVVLDRFCCKYGTNVRGGASKLFSFCKKWILSKNIKSIISWSDNRWSQGHIYEVLGFTLDADLPPDYSYVDLKKPGTRVSKQSQTKKNVNCPEDKTEKEWCAIRNLARIWDCGKKRWIFNFN